MATKAPKKVFLTTLSDLRRPLNANYYFYQCADGGRKYVRASFTNEPGAKYILSMVKIDKIVMIGSDLTWDKSRDRPLRANEGSFALVPYPQDVASLSKSLPYLKYSLKSFLMEGGAPREDVSNDIEPERRAELEAMAAGMDCLSVEDDRGLWFDIANRTASFFPELKSKLRRNIDQVYVTEEEYEKYNFRVKFSELPEVQWMQQKLSGIDEAIESLERVKSSMKFTLLGREFYILSGLRHVEREISDLELKKAEAERDVMPGLAARLWDLNRRLVQELQDIKANRLAKEVAYIQQYLFSLLKREMRLTPIQSNEDAVLCFVPLERKEGDGKIVENIREMVDAIRDTAAEDEDIELYIDMQGGVRTDGYVRNAVLSILGNEAFGHIKIKQVLATNYVYGRFANEIVDETERYSITDLVAGMNAFIRYGKADIIKAHYEQLGVTDVRLKKFINAMVTIDEAISICDIGKLEDGILAMKQVIGTNRVRNGNRATEIFSVLEDGIRRDYGKLLKSDTVDYIMLIRWSLRKGLIQQAITILEAKIPGMIVKDRILYYREEEAERLDALGRFGDETRDYVFIKKYIIQNTDKLRINDFLRAEWDKDYKNDSGDKVTILNNADQTKVAALLNKYRLLCLERNNLNHAKNNRKRSTVADITQDVERFLNLYLALAADARKQAIK